MELTTSWKEEGIKIGFKRGLKKGLAIGEKQCLEKAIWGQLTRQLGALSPRLQKRLEKISVAQLENLIEALVEIKNARDLTEWLKQALAKS